MGQCFFLPVITREKAMPGNFFVCQRIPLKEIVGLDKYDKLIEVSYAHDLLVHTIDAMIDTTGSHLRGPTLHGPFRREDREPND